MESDPFVVAAAVAVILLETTAAADDCDCSKTTKNSPMPGDGIRDKQLLLLLLL